MLLPDGILRAAIRWLTLLATSPFAQASAVLQSAAEYTDLTPTQYGTALDWLETAGLLVRTDYGYRLAASVAALTDDGVRQLLYAEAVAKSRPPWLTDADLYIQDGADLPTDALQLAQALGVSDDAAAGVVRRMQASQALAERARVGAAGEAALVRFLETHWPGSCTHVSQQSDAFGYDIVFAPGDTRWHLEVKSTSRRGRLQIYMSRNEYEVSRYDAAWRLVFVRLNASDELESVSTVRWQDVIARAPINADPRARWEVASFELSPADLDQGFPFCAEIAWPTWHDGADAHQARA